MKQKDLQGVRKETRNGRGRVGRMRAGRGRGQALWSLRAGQTTARTNYQPKSRQYFTSRGSGDKLWGGDQSAHGLPPPATNKRRASWMPRQHPKPAAAPPPPPPPASPSFYKIPLVLLALSTSPSCLNKTLMSWFQCIPSEAF